MKSNLLVKIAAVAALSISSMHANSMPSLNNSAYMSSFSYTEAGKPDFIVKHHHHDLVALCSLIDHNNRIIEKNVYGYVQQNAKGYEITFFSNITTPDKLNKQLPFICSRTSINR